MSGRARIPRDWLSPLVRPLRREIEGAGHANTKGGNMLGHDLLYIVGYLVVVGLIIREMMD